MIINAIGIAATRTVIKNSMHKIIQIMPIDTSIRIDLISTPKMSEKRISPSLYSFFRGLKKVLINNDNDKRDETYLLNRTKKLTRPPKTSLYQNKMRYKG